MHGRETNHQRDRQGLRALTESELLARSRVGDAQAYGELFERHRRFALGVALSVASSRSDAEDLVAVAVENTLRALSNGHGPSERYDHYVAVAIRRLAARLYATRTRHEQPMDDLELHRHLAEAAPPLEIDLPEGPTNDVLAGLSRQDQDILWATEVDGWTPHDLSGWLGTTAGAAAARSYRARTRLRKAYAAATTPRHLPDCSRPAAARRGRPADELEPCAECGQPCPEVGSAPAPRAHQAAGSGNPARG
ncbi:hypothetical protein KSP35_16520 [Aquihabitans sp. G128]|uniref:RNA polymerase sigma factor n=1 Tax=Aquihabitans sp. G128 TaxID=2849779 RepID=UPI001C24B9CE|nr:sigma factor [Aquihabitans sp. G128]QXC59962.1 hypothetical protein KSP35_16520 [Aquihabitans sp. G128]